jgi:Fe-S-cluster-containing dehydrogenase component
MERWHLVVDVEKCEDCNNCFLACKDEHVSNDWPGYAAPQPLHGHRWIDVLRKERGQYPLIEVAYLPLTCMQCDAAPCMSGSGGAVRKRSDGIVLIDPDAARGRREIVDSCPYGVIWWNEKENVPQKCTLCAHLLDSGWQQTRCVQACPTGALSLLKAGDEVMEARMASGELEILGPELATSPSVYYKNLYRFQSCFIAGSAAVRGDGVSECAKGARVSLGQGGRVLDETVCDAFGDFKFDRLPAGSGKYIVGVTLEGYRKESLAVELGESVSIGVIELAAI